MATQPRLLSGSTNGRGIKITTTTASMAVTIHTTATATGAGDFDEIWLQATNQAASAVVVTVMLGGTGSPADFMTASIPSKDGFYTLTQGKRLRASTVVKAYAASVSSIIIHGEMNRHVATGY